MYKYIFVEKNTSCEGAPPLPTVGHGRAGGMGVYPSSNRDGALCAYRRVDKNNTDAVRFVIYRRVGEHCGLRIVVSTGGSYLYVNKCPASGLPPLNKGAR